MSDRPATLLEVERLRLGLLDPDEAAWVRRRIDAFGDPTAGLPDDGTVFAADPPDRFLAQVRPTPRRVPVWAPALALLLLAGWFLLPSGVRSKGGPSLSVYRDAPGGAELLPDGATARPGDRLQLRFSAPRARHGLLFSVDGAGTVTVHHRFDAAAPGTVTLADGYRLDDAPGFEAFHLVVGPDGLDERALMGAAGERPPPAPPGGATASVVLRKDPR